ncbi:hypothetical protein Q1695_006198 [Nippostrongylus brasiliensis]|nr:hypothetical protein Q1695_006198 [Nippostrongylus brasiliensis]
MRACEALLCYSCFSDSGNSSCISSPRSTPWIHCDGQCQVWRLFSEADSSVYMFERSCSTHCRSGCTQLADMEHRFVGCSLCCSTNFCNTASSGSMGYSTPMTFFVLSAHHLFT